MRIDNVFIISLIIVRCSQKKVKALLIYIIPCFLHGISAYFLHSIEALRRIILFSINLNGNLHSALLIREAVF